MRVFDKVIDKLPFAFDGIMMNIFKLLFYHILIKTLLRVERWFKYLMNFAFQFFFSLNPKLKFL